MKAKITFVYFFISLLISADITQAQWVQTNPNGGFIDCFAVSGANIFAGGASIILSTNNGSNWTAVNTGLTQSLYSLALSGTNLFAGTTDGVFLSTNNGTSWTAVNTGLTNLRIRSLAVSGTNLFAGTDGGVFLSTNNGSSWTAVYTDNFIFSLGLSGTNLFASTSGGVFLTTNNGSSWSAVNDLPGFYSFAVSGTHLYAGGSSGVFLSTNNGTSWTNTDFSGLGFNNVYSLALIGTNLFVGTEGGVFLTTNNGSSWTAVNTGLAITPVYALALKSTYIFAGTGAGFFAMTGVNGVWRRPLSDFGITSVESEKNKLPTDFVLEPNYPNPFNPTTTIKYSIPQQAVVSLSVYDLLGREVAVLVNEEKFAGNYSIIFNGSNLASGVYLYRMQASNFVETKKLILIK